LRSHSSPAAAPGAGLPRFQRIGDHQYIGKQDRAVEAEAANGLERDFSSRHAILGQGEEAALLGSQRLIFGQIAPRLAHHPDRRRIAPFAFQNGQQRFLRRLYDLSRQRVLHIYPVKYRIFVVRSRAEDGGVYKQQARLPTA